MSSDVLMSETLSKMVASLNGLAEEQGTRSAGGSALSFDELSAMACSRMRDGNLDAGDIGPLLRNMVEAYVDRFQAFPFDVVETLFAYLALRDFPEEAMRGLVERLEQRYQKHYGVSLRKSGNPPVGNVAAQPTLDEEISQLRETLKYAAIAGERLDG
jgi:hypothetical protein